MAGGNCKAERNARIYEMREAGNMTLEEIGREFGIGKERVRQIWLKERHRRDARGRCPFISDELNDATELMNEPSRTRLRGAFWKNRVVTLEDALRLESEPGGVTQLRNVGETTRAEFCRSLEWYCRQRGGIR